MPGPSLGAAGSARAVPARRSSSSAIRSARRWCWSAARTRARCARPHGPAPSWPPRASATSGWWSTACSASRWPATRSPKRSRERQRAGARVDAGVAAAIARGGGAAGRTGSDRRRGASRAGVGPDAAPTAASRIDADQEAPLPDLNALVDELAAGGSGRGAGDGQGRRGQDDDRRRDRRGPGPPRPRGAPVDDRSGRAARRRARRRAHSST